MSKFMLLYYTEPGAQQNLPMEQIMKDWGDWIKGLEDKLVDPGYPFKQGEGLDVTSKGNKKLVDQDWPANGYSIIQADSMEEAVEIAQSNPSHKHFDKEAIVRVYPFGKMPEMPKDL